MLEGFEELNPKHFEVTMLRVTNLNSSCLCSRPERNSVNSLHTLQVMPNYLNSCTTHCMSLVEYPEHLKNIRLMNRFIFGTLVVGNLVAMLIIAE